jgi:hypothetical protein
LCGLGQTAPNPTLSTLRYFRKEYTDLLQEDIYGGPNGNGSANGKANRAELGAAI